MAVDEWHSKYPKGNDEAQDNDRLEVNRNGHGRDNQRYNDKIAQPIFTTVLSMRNVLVVHRLVICIV